MKKGLLLILGMLMMVSTAEASDGVKTSSKLDYYNYRNVKPIQFIEKGIKFYVFPNGEIEFKAQSRSRYNSRYTYRNGGRYSRRTQLHNVSISRDYYGRVKRVGTVFINYNRYGKVSRVGSVFIDYRRRRMTNVGGLYIRYNRYGEVNYFGQVKPRYSHRNYDYNRFYDGMILDFHNDYFFDTDFYDNFDNYDEDDDFYYYKSKKGKGLKKSTIIKRKKEHINPSKKRKIRREKD
jgi:hypothetical protein